MMLRGACIAYQPTTELLEESYVGPGTKVYTFRHHQMRPGACTVSSRRTAEDAQLKVCVWCRAGPLHAAQRAGGAGPVRLTVRLRGLHVVFPPPGRRTADLNGRPRLVHWCDSAKQALAATNRAEMP